MPSVPDTLAMLTIDPPRPPIAAAAAWIAQTMPEKPTPIIRSTVSGRMSATGS